MNVRPTPLYVFHELARPTALIAVALVAVQLTLTAVATPARAQDGSAGQLVDRLDRMERTLRTLSREVYRGEQPQAVGSGGAGSGTPPSAALATRFDQKLAQFEAELRELTGRVESLGHTVRQLNSRLDKLVSDVDFRLSSLERQRAAGQSGAAGQAPGKAPGDGASLNPDAVTGKPPQGSPQMSAAPRAAGVNQEGPATGGPITGTGTGRAPRTLGTITEEDLKYLRETNPAAALDRQPPPRQQAGTGEQSAAAPAASANGGILPEGSAEEQYKFAFSLLRQADYEQASRAFEAFIEAHPDTDLTPNAQYWLGETYYVRGDYRTAAEQFLTGYQKNPKGSKAADSLLKLGMSLIGLDQSKEACATFDKLSADFPNPPANITKVLARERARAECG